MSPKKENNDKMPSKKRGLGRGLEALFEDEEATYPQVERRKNPDDRAKKVLGIDKLYPGPKQPRAHFDDQAIEELAASIKEYGIIQPILVRPDKVLEGQYEIVAGERRWRASQKAQLHEVPVIIRELDDETTLQIALVENLQRKDLNAVEEALGYQRLNDEFGYSHEDIGKTLGKSRSHVANMIRLLELPDKVQFMIVKDGLTAGHARALLKAENPDKLAAQVIRENLSVRQTEKLVAEDQGRQIKHRKGSKASSSGQPKDSDTIALEKEVSNQLGMNVSIDMKDTSEGVMSINFKSLDQLDDVLRRLSQTPKY